MSSYFVTFDRIGRNRSVEPLTVDADSDDSLAEKIYRYAKPHLISRDIEVTVDCETGRGQIWAGWNNGGTFTVETISDGSQS